MELLKRILFGKRVEFDDPNLGKLSTRVNNKNPDAVYRWYFTTNRFDSAGETYISVDGNFQRPAEKLLEICDKILSTMDDLMPEVREILEKENPSDNHIIKTWQQELDIISITCQQYGTVEIMLGLKNKKDIFSVFWREGKILRVEY